MPYFCRVNEPRVLVEATGLRVSYDADNDWLYTQVMGWHDQASIQLSANQVYSCLEHQPCTKILSDHSELLGNWNGAVPYLRPWYFERLAAKGVQHFAWVYAGGYYDRVTMERACYHLTRPSTAIFNDVASAYDWLRNAPLQPWMLQ